MSFRFDKPHLLYIGILFSLFAGLGASLSSISPYVFSHFINGGGKWIFLGIQIAIPLGHFFSGWISDKTGKIRIFAIYGFLFIIPAQYLTYHLSDSLWWTILFAFWQRFLFTANLQWVTLAALETSSEHLFSQVRSAGTIGFMLIQLSLYLFSNPDLSIKLFDKAEQSGKFGSILYLPALLLVFWLPRLRRSQAIFYFRDALAILRSRIMLLFILLSFLFHFAFQVTDNYLGKYIETILGLDAVFLSWFLAVIIEIPFLIFIPKIVQRWGVFSLIYLAVLAGVCRYALVAWTVAAHPVGVLYFSQLFHSFLFAGYYMATIYWLRGLSPPHLYGSVFGLFNLFALALGGMTGNMVCGYLLQSKFDTFFLSQYRINPAGSFFSIFLLAASVFLLILPGFIYLQRLTGRIAEK